MEKMNTTNTFNDIAGLLEGRLLLLSQAEIAKNVHMPAPIIIPFASQASGEDRNKNPFDS